MADKPYVLLLGNGINALTSGYKWRDLVSELIDFAGLSDKVEVGKKPFPLLYEEIVLKSSRSGQKTEIDIKRFIAERVDKLSPNEIHAAVAKLSCGDLITTNYDHSIEKAIDLASMNLDSSDQKERKFNIFRRNKALGTNIWHIHGDQHSPSSITLGYEHYSGQLQRLRNYVVTGTGDSYKKSYRPLKEELKRGIVPKDSWVSLFFVKDIHMIGLALDFVEIDIWWLLSYRARALQIDRQFRQQNKITFFCPERYRDVDRFALLEALEVECHSVEGEDLDYYFTVLKKVAEGY